MTDAAGTPPPRSRRQSGNRDRRRQLGGVLARLTLDCLPGRSCGNRWPRRTWWPRRWRRSDNSGHAFRHDRRSRCRGSTTRGAAARGVARARHRPGASMAGRAERDLFADIEPRALASAGGGRCGSGCRRWRRWTARLVACRRRSGRRSSATDSKDDPRRDSRKPSPSASTALASLDDSKLSEQVPLRRQDEDARRDHDDHHRRLGRSLQPGVGLSPTQRAVAAHGQEAVGGHNAARAPRPIASRECRRQRDARRVRQRKRQQYDQPDGGLKDTTTDHITFSTTTATLAPAQQITLTATAYTKADTALVKTIHWKSSSAAIVHGDPQRRHCRSRRRGD